MAPADTNFMKPKKIQTQGKTNIFLIVQVEKLAENCRVCKGGLGIRKKKRNCKVCGLALCKKCSNKELLLYIESKDGEHQVKETKLAIIKVAGVSFPQIITI